MQETLTDLHGNVQKRIYKTKTCFGRTLREGLMQKHQDLTYQWFADMKNGPPKNSGDLAAFSLVTSSSFSWGFPSVQVLPRGLLLARGAWNKSTGRRPGGNRIRYLNHLYLL